MAKSFIPISSVLVALFCTAVLSALIAIAVNLFFFKADIQSTLNHQIEHIIELDHTVRPDTAIILEMLRNHTDIDGASVSYVTPERAASYMRQETGLDFIIDEENPFTALIRFQSEKLMDPDLFLLERDLNTHKGVAAVYIQHDIFKMIRNRLHAASLWVGVASGLFVLISFGLLASLYRLILYAERKKIKTMELVGATSRQIIGPYMWRFVGIALLSMLLAVLAGGLLYAYCYRHDILTLEHLPWTQVGVYTLATWAILLLFIMIMSAVIIRRFVGRTMEDLS